MAGNRPAPESHCSARRALFRRDLERFERQVVATKAVNELPRRAAQAELRHDVALHHGRGRRGERHHRCRPQHRQALSEQPIVGAKIMTPLRDAMRFVDGDEPERAPREELRETGDAQAFGRNEQIIERARDVVRAHLA